MRPRQVMPRNVSDELAERRHLRQASMRPRQVMPRNPENEPEFALRARASMRPRQVMPRNPRRRFIRSRVARSFNEAEASNASESLGLPAAVPHFMSGASMRPRQVMPRNGGVITQRETSMTTLQ